MGFPDDCGLELKPEEQGAQRKEKANPVGHLKHHGYKECPLAMIIKGLALKWATAYSGGNTIEAEGIRLQLLGLGVNIHREQTKVVFVRGGRQRLALPLGEE